MVFFTALAIGPWGCFLHHDVSTIKLRRDNYPGGENGVFHDQTRITLTTGARSGEIRYTLDGSQPTADSTLYRRPLTIDRSTIVRLTDGGTGVLDYYLAYPSEPDPVEVTVDLGDVCHAWRTSHPRWAGGW